ncbi:hypothetical protein [Myceligenerans pegani]|uniref:Uncharacterized protein n=1 Tax=Myceligenerans pegani TaxID=2776917 RepID=A0ABR9MX12_9MICO|nr:hypothetical protein [Myceligenerans sp. TRM 65318]MBE1875393.1 hypothetical protein [Myceligenerans sp. TRM 65318]MBE3017664.1 hypothetical protein [Myceligenerans sp. TRM 65318]
MTADTTWVPVADTPSALAWLDGQECPLTGYWAPDGFEDATWVLHAMYENDELRGLGTHDDVEKDAIARGLMEPDVVAGIDLSAATVDSGTPLGWVERPSVEWTRLYWRDHFGPSMDIRLAAGGFPPNDRALRDGSWSASIFAPPEGSLDEASLAGLLSTLAAHTDDGGSGQAFAFYGQVPANNYDSPTLFAGRLDTVKDLAIRLDATPSNLWPADRSWFVMTDWDITSTCIWGSKALIDQIREHPELETAEWTRPTG